MLMKRLFAVISFLFLYGNLYAKSFTDTLPSHDQTDDLIICGYEEWDAEIDYIKWARYLESNIVFDSTELDSIPAGIYKFYVRFAVDKEGKIVIVGIKDD